MGYTWLSPPTKLNEAAYGGFMSALHCSKQVSIYGIIHLSCSLSAARNVCAYPSNCRCAAKGVGKFCSLHHVIACCLLEVSSVSPYRMHRRARAPPSPAFMQAAKQTGGREGQVSEAVLRQARRSGQLNLSMRGLEVRGHDSSLGLWSSLVS